MILRWVQDRTGRFPQRPHYEPGEIDATCEAVVTGFLLSSHGAVAYPLSTNDMTILLEREASDLDLFADLSQEGPSVEGVTTFYRDRKPEVQIARELSEQPWRASRLRTTLAHELGHVKLHNFLWSLELPLALPLFEKPADSFAQRCRRETIVSASPSDWMEWQAAYASGAFLMPVSALRPIAARHLEATGLFAPISAYAEAGGSLISHVRAAFGVSADAARVRLLQLGYLTERTIGPQPTLFGPGSP